MPAASLGRLVDEVDAILEATATEREITTRVAISLREWLAEHPSIPPAFRLPDPERYVLYPLHVDPEGRFCIASAVWNVGQSTPVHGHETWGVVGIHSGCEHEVSYVKPTREATALTRAGEVHWGPGEVTVCCTTDDDVHWVRCGGEEPCVGIHIYGADIGALSRRRYDPVDGSVGWFTSQWASWPPLSELATSD